MRDTRLWFAIPVGLLLVVAQAQTPQPPRIPQATQAPQFGRFQIYSLNYGALSNNTALHETDVFRIDTETGETCRYLTSVQDGKPSDRWIKIDEPH